MDSYQGHSNNKDTERNVSEEESQGNIIRHSDDTLHGRSTVHSGGLCQVGVIPSSSSAHDPLTLADLDRVFSHFTNKTDNLAEQLASVKNMNFPSVTAVNDTRGRCEDSDTELSMSDELFLANTRKSLQKDFSKYSYKHSCTVNDLPLPDNSVINDLHVPLSTVTASQSTVPSESVSQVKKLAELTPNPPNFDLLNEGQFKSFMEEQLEDAYFDRQPKYVAHPSMLNLMSNFYKVKKPTKVINSISKELTGIQQIPQAQVQYLDKEIVLTGSKLV